MRFRHTIKQRVYEFPDLRTLLAKASPGRAADRAAQLAAQEATERGAARFALSDVPLSHFLAQDVIPAELDEVTRLIHAQHDRDAFAPIAGLTVGELRAWLLSASPAALAGVRMGLTPEMTAAAAKLMRGQDLIAVARKCEVITRFRGTIGLRGRLATRLAPDHAHDDPSRVTASILDGLRCGSGDAVIGISPATADARNVERLWRLIDQLRARHEIPTQACVLTHVTTTMQLMAAGVPVDLVFQSIAGSEAANRSFGVDLALLREAREQAVALRRGTLGDHVMYFQTAHSGELSAAARHGVDAQTCQARACAVARELQPLLVNTVVGFTGSAYPYQGKEVVRAGLEDHFCGKLLGLPMGCDVRYASRAEADPDDVDTLLTLLGVAGVNYVVGVAGTSASFRDALYLRECLGLRPAPEFEAWLMSRGIFEAPTRAAWPRGVRNPPGFVPELVDGAEAETSPQLAQDPHKP